MPMWRAAGYLFLVAMAGLLTGTPALAGCEPSCPPESNGQAAIEAGLLPAIVFDDAPLTHWSIPERMARYRVPGASIAVIADGKLAWSAGYGVRKAGGVAEVSPRTLFQAASISKPVAAAVALELAGDSRLQLDGSVNTQLHGWKIPANEHGDGDAVTLRQLLSHTSGLGLHGFPGYAGDAALPTLLQILEGKPPATSPPVALIQAPGAGYRYSGAGYEVVQLLLEQVSGQSFAALADERVFRPLQMQRSTFETALLPRFTDDIARGHGFDGHVVEGGWRRYPALAAAGLWSTPTDLAHFAIAMMDPQHGKPGLGFGVHGEGDAMYFDHAGANSGYRTYLVVYPARGEGLVVMTNGDGGENLIGEIRRSVARSYGWPDFEPGRVTSMPATTVELDARTGEYAVERYGFAISIRRSGDALIASTPRGSSYTFRKVGPGEFTAVEDASSLRFDHGNPGELEVWGMTARKLPAR